ncbi:eukaryotic translation elongation factor 1 epsilon-1 [Orussus abietinus]|uniref:eukaryotic translation elongation factor 1 epsilon-1 n=1 Tax=Orussus abietinus TaxID=222816 RepID=UPI000625167A|nr:eukaryotic translation elongation factor 1 epsilon-1 [Orussus abietinus]
MVVYGIECLNKISEYLEVTPGKLQIIDNVVTLKNHNLENEDVKGFETILLYLASVSKYSEILGLDSVVKAQTRQWLEYAQLCVNYSDVAANAKRILKELNTAVKNNTYICGTQKTLADLVLYYGMYTILSGLTHQEKAAYINVSRWFDNMQQEKKLRQDLKLVDFKLLHLLV